MIHHTVPFLSIPVLWGPIPGCHTDWIWTISCVTSCSRPPGLVLSGPSLKQLEPAQGKSPPSSTFCIIFHNTQRLVGALTMTLNTEEFVVNKRFQLTFNWAEEDVEMCVLDVFNYGCLSNESWRRMIWGQEAIKHGGVGQWKELLGRFLTERWLRWDLNEVDKVERT